MKKTALATALILAASAAQAEWVANGIVAVGNPGSPVLVGVSFDYTESCNVAHLFVLGNRDIERIGLVVDGASHGSAEAVDVDDGFVVVVAGPSALRAIKYGGTAGVVTDQGSLIVDLEGSAAALDAAYAGCLLEMDKAVSRILKPLEPSALNVPAGSVNF